MTVGPLFDKLMNCQEKIIILQGGGDACKTSDSLKYFGIKATQDKDVYTVTAQDTPNLRLGALRAFQMYVEPELSIWIKSFNKSENTFYFKNGSVIEFKGFEDEQDARGSERGYLFINEANSRSYDLFWQLQRKTRKRVILDYNPTSTFWAHSKIMGLVDGEIPEKQFQGRWRRFITNHTHNPFLSQEDHDAYENITDPDMYKVYSKGFTGKIKGLIFGHFKKIKLDELPTEYDRIAWGEDYGFTNDPSACVKMYVKGRQRFFQKLCYRSGMTADELVELKIANGWKHGQNIFGDTSKGPADAVSMINQQRMKGIPVGPPIKSISAGISKLREFECFYVDDKDFDFELSMYRWVMARDIANGNEVMTNIPVDKYNHILDACRYAGYTDSLRHRS